MHWFPLWEIRQGTRDVLAERKTSLSPKGNKWDGLGVRVTQPRQAVIDFSLQPGRAERPGMPPSPSPAHLPKLKPRGTAGTMNGATVWVLIGGKNLLFFFFSFFFGFQLQAPPARERKNNKKPTTKQHQPHDLTFFNTALVKSKAVKPVLWYRTYLLVQPLGLNGHFVILNWTCRLALKKNIISEKVSVIWFWILK